MSLVNSANAELERSSLLTLERLTEIRRSASLLPAMLAKEIERLWMSAHTTEFFNSTDMMSVERAERVINHGLRFAASEAAGSC